jgi:hypothetical protein
MSVALSRCFGADLRPLSPRPWSITVVVVVVLLSARYGEAVGAFADAAAFVTLLVSCCTATENSDVSYRQHSSTTS